MTAVPLPDHATCARTLIDGMSSQGIDATVSDLPPLVAGPYTADPFICPRGTSYWLEPTGEQIAKWVKAGTR